MSLEQVVLHPMCPQRDNDVAVKFFVKVIPSLFFRVEGKLFSNSVCVLLSHLL